MERVIHEDGWTKIAMTKMWKLDSFMKESQRFNGIGLSEHFHISLATGQLIDSGHKLH